MESIKLLLEQMLNLVQHQSTGQPNDAYEIIGKLELLKSYFLTEAMHVNVFSGVSLFQSIPPPLPTPPLQPTPPIEAVGQQTFVSNQQMMPQQPQAVGNVEQTTQVHIQNQALIPQPAGPFPPNPRLWQVVDEALFEVVNSPVLWFSKLINSERSKMELGITSEKLVEFIAKSPRASFAQSSLFTDMTLPITLYSKKLDQLFGGAPGLLVHKGGETAFIYWPSVGKFFVGSNVVDVWYQWKVCGPRYMLIVRVDVQDPSGAGSSGAGPSGTGQCDQSRASKRPRQDGV